MNNSRLNSTSQEKAPNKKIPSRTRYSIVDLTNQETDSDREETRNSGRNAAVLGDPDKKKVSATVTSINQLRNFIASNNKENVPATVTSTNQLRNIIASNNKETVPATVTSTNQLRNFIASNNKETVPATVTSTYQLRNFIASNNKENVPATVTSENQLKNFIASNNKENVPATVTSANEFTKPTTSKVDDASEDQFLDCASVPSITLFNMQLVSYLCSIFPDACPNYIKSLCANKPMNHEAVEFITSFILNSNGKYPKREVTVKPEVYPENQLDILKEFLPDADPDYLAMMCDRFKENPEAVRSFINEALEERNYPSIKEYQRRQQLSAQHKQYTTEFSAENFLRIIPDPQKFFADPSRVVTMDDLSCHYALIYLRNTYNRINLRKIQSTFKSHGYNFLNTVKELDMLMKNKRMWLKSERKQVEMPNTLQNIPLLQEIAYVTHKSEIDKHLSQREKKEKEEIQKAKSKGLMKTCECCYDEEVLPKNIFSCENGCSFCKSCIVTSTEVRFSEGKLDFLCLMDCSSHFSLLTLQAVLSPKLFSKIAQKKALEEVKSAGIEDLETCPFCDFATIPAAGYSVFSCFNPDCMKESCRLCKEPSHIPLKCEEVEKDEDVRARTYVENKMTEALLKTCWKCGLKFFKEEGCNMMTCLCGASICYVSNQPVDGLKHFNGIGAVRFYLWCPLFSDSNVLNKKNVLKAAEQAKAEIGNKILIHDPTKNVEQYYQQRAAQFPHQQRLGRLQQEAQIRHEGRMLEGQNLHQ